VPASSGGTAQESAARAKTTGHHPLTDGQAEDARQALVTGYAEYRASLQDKKQYRRAIKIDLKLPKAAAALAGPRRRKEFGEGEEGRQAWKAAFNAYAGDFAYFTRSLARRHRDGEEPHGLRGYVGRLLRARGPRQVRRVDEEGDGHAK
jgi:hypothetical protein